MPVASIIQTVTTTVANGTAISSAAVDLQAAAVCGIILPTLTSTSFSIQGCDTSGGTYATLKALDGTAATITVATVGAGAYVYLDPTITAGWPFIKIATSGNEGADRVFKLLTRPV